MKERCCGGCSRFTLERLCTRYWCKPDDETFCEMCDSCEEYEECWYEKEE
jgi:hypothetical protein